MHVQLDITKNLKDQFEHFFKLREINSENFLDPAVGGGQVMEFLEFPGQMEFYHFKRSYFKVPVQMKSINPSKTRKEEDVMIQAETLAIGIKEYCFRLNGTFCISFWDKSL